MKTMSELADRIGGAYPNADTGPVVIIPWGENEASGMMVDHEGGHFRIGVYADLRTGDANDHLLILEVNSADEAWDILEMLTDDQPEGTDWTAWATQWGLDIFPNRPSPIDLALGAVLAQIEDLSQADALVVLRRAILGRVGS